jgi:tRNA(Ser,Leu) C12 N-acetylase TAN1
MLMKDWNVVITVYQDGFRRVLRTLKEFGPVERSPYYNVLLMRVEDPIALLEAIERKTEQNTALYDAISRVAPAMHTVEFHSAEEFRERIKPILLDWLPRLSGSSFHIRLRRRGDGHDLRTPDAERFCDDLLLQATATAGAPCRISFTDPDAIIAIDTVDDRAGVGLWTREDLARHRLLRPD